MTTPATGAAVTIREAIRADLLAIYDIEKRSFEQPWPYTAFERQLDAPAFLVAEEPDQDGAVVGYVVADAVDANGGRVGHVKDLAVAPERRGEGIGSGLLASALAELAHEGVGRVKLEVREGNRAAKALYEAFDFELHHVLSGYYDDGEDAHVMVRTGPST